MTYKYTEESTTFDPSETASGSRLDGSESRYAHYKRLSYANTLRWNGKWRDENEQTQKDAVAIIESIAGQLELTRFQRERALRYFDSLPDRFNVAYSTALLALCVCGLSGVKDGRDYHPNQLHPNTTSDGDFARVAESVGVGYSDLLSCWRRVDGAL